MKKFALCIHDLRSSDQKKIIETIHFVRETFKTVPLTIHLIVDSEINDADEVFGLLKREIEDERIEIVFHGVTHRCKPGTSRFLAWYHKNEAEFLDKSFNITDNRLRYNKLNEILQIKTGFCPPCWIAGQEGWKFINSLCPLYIEKLLSYYSENKHFFSLPVSLASNSKKELFFLKGIATVISSIAILLNHSRLRLVIHSIDLINNDSVDFLSGKKARLISKGFIPVLQKNLIKI